MDLPNDLTPAEEEFASMVRQHDLTYQYSDDHGVWKTGNAEWYAIIKKARDLPLDRATLIWNHFVGLKLTPNSDREFLWTPDRLEGWHRAGIDR